MLAPRCGRAVEVLGVFMPEAAQAPDGSVTITLGSKGVIECELVSSGEKWGRGPTRDMHSSNRARLDSPAWHLVQALDTLVDTGGEPAIDGFFETGPPAHGGRAAMLDVAAEAASTKRSQESARRQDWARDASWQRRWKTSSCRGRR